MKEETDYRIQEIMNESRTSDRTRIDKQILDSKGRINAVSDIQYKNFYDETSGSAGVVSERLARAMQMVEQNLRNP